MPGDPNLSPALHTASYSHRQNRTYNKAKQFLLRIKMIAEVTVVHKWVVQLHKTCRQEFKSVYISETNSKM